MSHPCIMKMIMAASAARGGETGPPGPRKGKVPMLSLHTGYDTAYLTDAVGGGAAATDYYTAAKGEPPGYWQGAGARALGLEGMVDADVMKRLYHEDIGPDGQALVRRQRKANYP